MERRVRAAVPALTGLLTLVSLALVVAAARGLVPSAALPPAPSWLFGAIPHVNAAISVVAVALIVLGVRAARSRRFDAHRRYMAAAFALFVTFLALYLWKVAAVGPTRFPAGGAVEAAYLAVLAVHVALAVVCLPLLYHVLLLAATHTVGELPKTNHARIARVAAPLWVVSFVLGVVVYVLLYWAY